MIDFRWVLIKKWMLIKLGLPYFLYQASFLIYVFSEENELNLSKWWKTTFAVSLIGLSVNFLIQEKEQFYR